MFTIKEFLRAEVKPALGCTEPGAVALAVARAKAEIGDQEIQKISVVVSDSIYKNGVAVGIPGTDGLKGNAIAAALASVCGDHELGLEVLKNCSQEAVREAETMIEAGKVEIIPDLSRHGVYVEAVLTSPGDRASCTIKGTHTNIVKVTSNEKVLLENIQDPNTPTSSSDKESIPVIVSQMKYNELLAMVNDMDEEDMDYVFEGIEMNMTIADYGFAPENRVGLEIGKTLLKETCGEPEGWDLGLKIKAYCASASDARMAGAPLPVMSSAGSGNHGITAILPVALAGEAYGNSREEIAKAVAISHLSTSFIKSRVGRLSPICGCAVAAGAGAASGIVYLTTGDLWKAQKAMELVIGNLVGMVCDGAKETCALKVATGAMEAYHAALLVDNGHWIEDPQGVIDNAIEKTVENAAAINVEGMKEVDRIIIDFVSERYK